MNACKNENSSLKNIISDLRSRVDFEKMKAEHSKHTQEQLEVAVQKIKLEKDKLMIEIAEINAAIIQNVALTTKNDHIKKQLHTAHLKIQSLERFKDEFYNLENEKPS